MVYTMFVQLLRLTFDADRCHFCRFIEAKLNKKYKLVMVMTKKQVRCMSLQEVSPQTSSLYFVNHLFKKMNDLSLIR